MLRNEKLLHICNLNQFTFKIAPHDKFTLYAFLDLHCFDANIGFVAIYAVLCGAKMNSTFLSVEQKGQI